MTGQHWARIHAHLQCYIPAVLQSLAIYRIVFTVTVSKVFQPELNDVCVLNRGSGLTTCALWGYRGEQRTGLSLLSLRYWRGPNGSV